MRVATEPGRGVWDFDNGEATLAHNSYRTHSWVRWSKSLTLC